MTAADCMKLFAIADFSFRERLGQVLPTPDKIAGKVKSYNIRAVSFLYNKLQYKSGEFPIQRKPVFTDMNTSKKVDSKGLDNLAVKLKEAKFAELNAGDLKTEGCRNEEGASRSSASDKNLLEKRL